MTEMIESSIHHFEDVGFAGNGDGSGKEGRAKAISASLVGAGVETVEASFGFVSTFSVGCWGGLVVQGAGG